MPPAIRTPGRPVADRAGGRARRARHGHGRRDPAIGVLRRSDAEAAAADALAAQDGLDADAGLHAHQARRRQGGQIAGARPASRPTPSTATRANRPGSGCLLRFKSPQPLVLVATDIAARGLDIDEVSHVINFDLPIDAGQLRPSHRPHGPGGRGRGGRLVLRSRRAVEPCRRSSGSRGKRWQSKSSRRACPPRPATVAFRHENRAGQAGGLGIVAARACNAILGPPSRGPCSPAKGASEKRGAPP